MPWGEDSACVFGCAHNVIPLPVVGATVHELERRGGRYGLIAICEGGGTANAMIIERMSEVSH